MISPGTIRGMMRAPKIRGTIRPARMRTAIFFVFLLALPLASRLSAQRRNDPLTPAEIDQLRDAMMEPEDRLKLYVKFSRDRMTKLEQMRADPKTTERGLHTHDLLQDFLNIYEELDDNVEMYVGRKNDIRRPLKLVIEADTEFQSRLRALKDAANADPKEAKQYEFVLNDAIDTVDSSAEDHRKTVAEVEDYMKRKKKQ
jgi:hypothetical protein